VAADVVERFLGRYSSHRDSPDLDSTLMLNYVGKEREAGSLHRWSVAVMAAGDDGHGSVRLGGLDFSRITRAKLRVSAPVRADIKTLMSKDHRVVDLDIAPAAARAMNESALMDARNNDPVARNRALLLLYPIDPNSKPDAQNQATRLSLEAATDVIGMAVVFPGNAESKVRTTHVTVDLSSAEVETPDEAEFVELTGQESP
jgi:hypothetical protein